MHDPSTSTLSLRPPSTAPTPTPPPSPGASPARLRTLSPVGLVGYRVLSGIGEELGRVLGVVNGRDGRPKKLCFVEHDGDEPRYVPLRFVRDIAPGVVRLAGPREGYHITRVRGSGALGRVMADPAEDEGGVWAGS